MRSVPATPTAPSAAPAPTRPPRTRARGWGIASTVCALLGVLPFPVVLALANAVDENYSYLMIPAFGWVLLTAPLGLLLGLVGLLLAAVDRRCLPWPALGTLLSAGLLGAIAWVVYA